MSIPEAVLTRLQQQQHEAATHSVLVYENISYTSTQLLAALQKQVDMYQTHTALGARIAVMMEPSDRLVITLLALLSSGRPYVPILPSTPQERVQQLVLDAECVAIVTDNKGYPQLAGITIAVLTYDEGRQTTSSPCTHATPSSQELACILYTSGSTGLPKGVKISHGAAYNFANTVLSWGTRGTIGCMKTVISFMDHVSEIFPPLMLSNGTLIVMPQGASQNLDVFVSRLITNKVTCLVLVPSFLRALLAYLRVFQNLVSQLSITHVDSSGEPLMLDVGKEFFLTFPNATLANAYGSTETVCDSHVTVYRSMEELINTVGPGGRIPIGTECPGYHSWILPSDFIPNSEPINAVEVAEGTVGELYVAGPISSGYLRDEMTKERFITLYRGGVAFHAYKLGDLAVRNPTTKLCYCMGRTDGQIKVRGQRVDTSEIRRVLMTVDGVQQGVIGIHDAGLPSQEVIAFYVGTASVGVVARKLHDSLPGYMLPKVHCVTTIPSLDNGKVNTIALVKEWCDVRTQRKKESPLDLPVHLHGFAVRVVTACSNVLNRPPSEITLSESFVEQGGSSVTVVLLLEELKKQGIMNASLAILLKPVALRDIVELLCEGGSSSGPGPMMLSRHVKFISLKDYDGTAESVIEYMTVCFRAKDPVKVIFPEITDDAFRELMAAMYPVFKATRLSFVAVDVDTGSMVGCVFSVNVADEEQHPPPDIPILFRLIVMLESTELEVREKLLQTYTSDQIGAEFVLATDLSLTEEESVGLALEMEREVIRAAREENLKVIISTNTHFVTQHIAGLLGYVTMKSVRAKDIMDPRVEDGNVPLFTSSLEVTVNTDVFTL